MKQMPEFALTPQQQAVVDNRGGTLLVSAAAGSGKTKVLVDRVMARIRQENRSIHEFLIITFTNAAAAELRMKISDALSAMITEDPLNRHLQRQQNLLHLAQISTVHAFCGALIRQYGYLLNVSPEYAMLEDTQRSELLQEALESVLEEAYAQGDPGFLELSDTIGAGRTDAGLEEAVLSLYSKALSQTRPVQWLEGLRTELPENAELTETVWGQVCLDAAKKVIEKLLARHAWAVAVSEQDPLLVKKYYPAFVQQEADLRRILQSLSGDSWDSIGPGLKVTYLSMSVRNYPDEQQKTALQNLRADTKKAIAALAELFARPQAELIAEQNAMAPALNALIRVTIRLDEVFSQEKRRRNVLDFGDQEHLAIRLLTDETGRPTDTAHDVRQRFCEIMVDEYQDSNQVQECIFTAISAEGDTNRFLVGDIKQSIYGFREAEPQMFRDKYKTYANATEVHDTSPRRLILSRNFRSRPEILEAVNHVFASVMSETVGELTYGPDEQLYPGRADIASDGQCHVKLTLLQTEDKKEAGEGEDTDKYRQEAEWTAEQVSRYLREGLPVASGASTRPVRPEDFALLMRGNDPMRFYRSALERRGIPVKSEAGQNIFGTTEGTILLNFLRVLDNPHQDIPLLSVLCSPVYRFSNEQLSVLHLAAPAGRLYDAMDLVEEDWCRSVKAQLDGLSSSAGSLSADDLLFQVLQETGLMTIACAMDGGAQRKENLLTIYEYVRNLAAGSHLYLYELLRILERTAKAGTLLTSSGASGVTITTIHKSKGLEYPVVFLCDLSRKFNLRELKQQLLLDSTLGIGARIVDRKSRTRYPGLAYEALTRSRTAKLRSEELRVLYVAMTRARDYLFMNYHTGSSCSFLETARLGAGSPAEVWAADSAGSLGDWVLLAAMSRMESGALFERYGRPCCQLTVSPYPWTVTVEDPSEVSCTRYIPCETAAEESDSGLDAAALEAALSWHYSHADAVLTPSKLTATALKGRVKDQEAAEETAEVKHHYQLLRPDFISEQQGLSPTEKGTAAHLFLQYADYTQLDTIEKVEDELIRMVDEDFLTQLQADAVNPEHIVRLFQSELGQQLLHSQHVVREYKFSLLVDAGEYYPALCDQDEKILLQGVIDAAILNPDGITVIDFKTDRVTEHTIEARTAVYRTQVEVYRKALERITGIPVTRCVLYYLSAGKAVSV